MYFDGCIAKLEKVDGNCNFVKMQIFFNLFWNRFLSAQVDRITYTCISSDTFNSHDWSAVSTLPEALAPVKRLQTVSDSLDHPTQIWDNLPRINT